MQFMEHVFRLQYITIIFITIMVFSIMIITNHDGLLRCVGIDFIFVLKCEKFSYLLVCIFLTVYYLLYHIYMRLLV